MNVPADGSELPDQTRAALPTPPAYASILARGRRQGMDWSLVLISQGIEAVLCRVDGSPQFELRISPHQLQRAEEVIRLYEDENRGRRWKRHIPASGGLWFDFRSVLWAAAMVAVYFLNDRSNEYLKGVGAFHTKAVAGGQWWRAFTAECLHVDLSHLASNLTTGLLFLGIAMARFGVGAAMFATLLAGALANMIGYWIRPGEYIGLGASGTVMAALGMVAMSAFWTEEWRSPRRLAIARGFLAGVFLLILFGFSPTGDILVHVAGFIVGALLAAVMKPLTQRSRQDPEKSASSLPWDGWFALCAVLTLAIPWWLALTRSRS